jgi:hypothetical protein
MNGVKVYGDADVSGWDISSLEVNKNGGKSCFIYTSSDDKTSPRIQLCRDDEVQLKSPFGLNSYNDSPSDRKNLEFSVTTPELEAFFRKVDEFALQTAKENSERWFKKSLSEEEIKSMYKPCLTENNSGYPPTVRSKVAINNASQKTRIWKVKELPDGTREYEEGVPEDLSRNNRYIPIIAVGGVFFMQRIFGVSLTCTDIMVFEKAKTAFPFICNADYRPAKYEDVSVGVARTT